MASTSTNADEYGFLPWQRLVFEAVESNDPATIARLLDQALALGADLNAAIGWMTPLGTLATAGRASAAAVFIEKGAKPWVPVVEFLPSENPVHVAAGKGDIPTLRVLLGGDENGRALNAFDLGLGWSSASLRRQ